MWNCVRRWGITATIALTLTACARGMGDTANCVVNPDQSHLFKGHWTSHPIPLAVVANDFSASELGSLEAAIQTWNAHFEAAKGFSLYMTGSSTLAQVSTNAPRANSTTVCSQTVIGPGGFTNRIYIYKDSSSWMFGSSVIGVTSLCPISTANSQYRMFVSAVMELNWVDYFRMGKPQPDLQSVVLHELGHMLGLDHTCNGNGCSNATDEYRQAVMYPALGFDGNVGRQKRELQTNDQGRANCLY